MVFLENHLTVEHPGTGLKIVFNAFDALLGCRTVAEEPEQEAQPDDPQQQQQPQSPGEAKESPDMGSAPSSMAVVSEAAPKGPAPAPIKCKSAQLWQHKSMAGIEQLQLEHDWTYTTMYRGTLCPRNPAAPGSYSDEWQWSPEPINLPLLMKREPILWFTHLILFEDELHDNGVSQLSLKARAMPSCWLVLLRFWLRVDDVLVRIYDTRLFVEFGKPYVIREQQLREASAEELLKMGIPSKDSLLQDPDRLSRRLPVRHQRRDRLELYPAAAEAAGGASENS